MLGDHEGLTPLDDPQAAAKPVLRVMGRLKVGGDVPKRQKLIARALAQIQGDDRHWMEALASRLSGDDGIEAIPAHLAALAAAWELREDELATLIRSVNSAGQDPFSGRAIKGIVAAKPEVGERLMKGQINSDEVMLRVALAHAFRRDPGSTFQMFMIDGVVQQLAKALKMGVSDFVKSCLERFDASPAPEGAWGYVMVLRNMSSKGGYFIYPPSDQNRAQLKDIRGKLEGMMGPLGQEAFFNHVAAAAVSGHLGMGDAGGFAALMSAVMEEMNERFLVVYARDEEGQQAGTHTQILPIPANSPEEARRIAVAMPEVRMHDDMRQLTEFMAQQRDIERARND